jgi:hypothetical protein
MTGAGASNPASVRLNDFATEGGIWYVDDENGNVSYTDYDTVQVTTGDGEDYLCDNDATGWANFSSDPDWPW